MEHKHNIPIKKWEDFYENYTKDAKVFVTIFEENFSPNINTYYWTSSFVINPSWIVLDIR